MAEHAQAPVSPSEPANAFPLRLDRPAECATVQAGLGAAGFDEATICRVLGIKELADLGSATPALADRNAGSPALAALIKLFLFAVPLTRAAIEEAIAPHLLAAFRALDLLRAGRFAVGQEPGEWLYAPVLLYPVGGFLIASDRHNNPDGSPFVPPADIVFPAIFAGTLRFLGLLPAGPMEAALDLCSGTGIAAMILGRAAGRAVAADITARSTHFARFNRLLNGCDRVEVVQGDLYAPVAGETFDVIVAHPPYVPALDDTLIYRDGGETGEGIVRRCVEGLPRHLRPGGLFVTLCAGWDTGAGTFEGRARAWLGDPGDDFDMLFAVGSEKAPGDFVREWAEHRDAPAREEIGRWNDVFARIGARSQVYGALVIRRRIATERVSAARPARTSRHRLSSLTDAGCIAWMLRWQDWTGDRRTAGTLSGAIADLRLRLPATVRVVVTHSVAESRLTPANFVIESPRPFIATTRVDAWMAALLNAFDGEEPAHAIYGREHAAGRLPASFGPENFTDLIERFIERGYLEIAAPPGVP